MKIISFLFILIFSFNLAFSKNTIDDKPLAAYMDKDSIWHVIDYDGKDIFEPVFLLDVAGYSENLLRVKTVIGKKIRWCFMDLSPIVKIIPDCQYVTDFTDGMAMTMKKLNDKGDLLYGFVNTRGEMVVPTEMLDGIQFSEGLAYIRDAERRGYIDTSGKYVLEMLDLVGYPFSNGIAAVSNSFLRVGYIDKTGKRIIDFQFDEPALFNDGLAPASKSGPFGFINTKGEEIIPFKYDNVQQFSEGRAFVGNSDAEYLTLWAMIDTEGITRTNFNFTIAFPFSEGKAAVKTTENWGFIDRDGRFAIEPKFNFASSFVDGLAFAGYIDGTIGFINTNGEFKIEIKDALKIVDLRLNKVVLQRK